jgi:hypothetical protein
MASNTTKRLDKLARGIQQLTELNHGTVYVREGEEVHSGFVVVRREYVECANTPEKLALTLPPLASEPTGNVFGLMRNG